MAKRFSRAIIGETKEEKAWIRKFVAEHTPFGWDKYVDGTGMTIYAANAFDPDTRGFLRLIRSYLRQDSLPYTLKVDDYYDVYEVSAQGAYRVGWYEIVGLDPDGCGPIMEYRACEKRRWA